MSDKDQTKDKENFLRRRAKELLEERSENLDGLSEIDIRSLVHELRVYQIELEMQNEELRRVQKELEKSRSRYADLYNRAPVGYFTLDKTGLIQEVNFTGAALLRKERKHLINRPFPLFVAVENRDVFYSYTNQLLNTTTKQSCELRMLRKEGSTFYAQLEGTAMFDEYGNFSHFIMAMLDVTVRKQAEEALKENFAQLSKKNRYETIISTVTRSVHQSINLQEVLEHAVEEMSKNIEGVDNISIYLIEGKEAVLKAYRGYPSWFINRVSRIPYPKGFTWKTIIEGKPIYCADVDEDTVIGPAGREMGTKSYASMPIYFQGKTVGCININSFKKNAFDEEELKLLVIIAQQIEVAINNAQQTEALRQSEERYRILFDQSPVGVYIFDKDYKITRCNERMAQILHSSCDKIIGVDLRKLRNQCVQPLIEEVFEGQSPVYEGLYEATKSQAKLWVYIRLSPLRDAQGEVIGGMAVVEDITEQKQAEEAQKEAKEKLELRVKERTKELAEVNEELKKEIATRKQVEKALRESEERYRTLYEDNPGKLPIKASNTNK